MPIITHPQNREYDEGYEGVWGRKCFRCKKVLDEAVAREWEAREHDACAAEAAAYADAPAARAFPIGTDCGPRTLGPQGEPRDRSYGAAEARDTKEDTEVR